MKDTCESKILPSICVLIIIVIVNLVYLDSTVRANWLSDVTKYSYEQNISANIYNEFINKYGVDLLQYDWFKDNISNTERLLLERFMDLEYYIPNWINICNKNIVKNDTNSKYWERKLIILKDEELLSNIIHQELYLSYTYQGNYDDIPIIIFYPSLDMKQNVDSVVYLINHIIYELENIFGKYPDSDVLILYGFTLDTDSLISMEDKMTFYERTSERHAIEQDVIGEVYNWYQLFAHELSHSYFASESLTQFLDVYLINIITFNSSDTREWDSGRNGWIFDNDGYIDLDDYGSPGLLKIYNIIGQNNMMRLLNELYMFKKQGIWKDVYLSPTDESSNSLFIELCDKYTPIGSKSEVSNISHDIFPRELERKIMFNETHLILTTFTGIAAALILLHLSSRTKNRVVGKF